MTGRLSVSDAGSRGRVHPRTSPTPNIRLVRTGGCILPVACRLASDPSTRWRFYRQIDENRGDAGFDFMT